jgi:hypothetical protein
VGKKTQKKSRPLKNGDLISIAISMAKIFWSTYPHPSHNYQLKFDGQCREKNWKKGKIFRPLKNGKLILVSISTTRIFWSTGPHLGHNLAT